jgi:hypothetical protein
MPGEEAGVIGQWTAQAPMGWGEFETTTLTLFDDFRMTTEDKISYHNDRYPEWGPSNDWRCAFDDDNVLVCLETMNPEHHLPIRLPFDRATGEPSMNGFSFMTGYWERSDSTTASP